MRQDEDQSKQHLLHAVQTLASSHDDCLLIAACKLLSNLVIVIRLLMTNSSLEPEKLPFGVVKRQHSRFKLKRHRHVDWIFLSLTSYIMDVAAAALKGVISDRCASHDIIVLIEECCQLRSKTDPSFMYEVSNHNLRLRRV